MRHYPPLHQTQQTATFHFSHNWAAVIGILVCLVLLHIWFQWTDPKRTEDERRH